MRFALRAPAVVHRIRATIKSVSAEMKGRKDKDDGNNEAKKKKRIEKEREISKGRENVDGARQSERSQDADRATRREGICCLMG